MKARFRSHGDTKATEAFLEKAMSSKVLSILDAVGREGVEALRAATPKKSGKTAASWTYEIRSSGGGTTISWYNTNTNRGENIAILIQYGHGTGWGGYVQGIDYINPAMRPVLKNASDRILRELNDA